MKRIWILGFCAGMLWASPQTQTRDKDVIAQSKYHKAYADLNSAMKIYKLVPLAYPYTQGSLIEEMKNRGIGRPSTYAQIVQKLLDRGYVIERKNFLFPTKLGKEVYNYLIRLKEAEKFVKEEFTRILEELMDKIEQGQAYYIDVLKDLYWEVLKIEKLRKEHMHIK